MLLLLQDPRNTFLAVFSHARHHIRLGSRSERVVRFPAPYLGRLKKEAANLTAFTKSLDFSQWFVVGEFLSTARRVASDKAFEIGLVSRVCDPVLNCALDFARSAGETRGRGEERRKEP